MSWRRLLVSESDRQPRANARALGVAPSSAAKRPTILSFAADWANLLTLIGLGSGILSIYFALNAQFHAAVLALVWAVLFDWFDGPVARRMSGRTKAHQLIGVQLDSLVDVISSAAAPGILLLAYAGFSPWFYPGVLAIVLAGVLRLAYFNVFGVGEDGAVAGLSIDFTPLVVSGVFLLNGPLNHDAFAAVLYAVVIGLAILHVAPFRMRKLGGSWVLIVTAYALALTVAHSLILWVN
jgi:phosphatidylserine synthase